MNKKDVAALLKISTRTVDRMMERGDIPFHKVGNSVRFDTEDIEEYLKRVKKQS